MVTRRTSVTPARGDIWYVDFSPTRGHEQAGIRPAVVISATYFNQGPAELAVVIPLTTTERNVPTHIFIQPPNGGVKADCYAMCEQLRSVSLDRFDNRLGSLNIPTLNDIEFAVTTLLGL
jgi:mRNA interferase MazF